VDGYSVVWRTLSDFVLILSGSDEYDELVLEDEVMPLIVQALTENTDKKLTEPLLLHSDNYGKVSLSLLSPLLALGG
jgi:hypothetical protein